MLPTHGTSQRQGHLYQHKTWLSLRIWSRAAVSSMPPLYYGGDIVSGKVEVDLNKPELFKEISITMQAGSAAVGAEKENFLDMKQILFTEATNPISLSAKHSWVFEFTFPSHISLKNVQYPLPPSFSERGAPIYIDYGLVLTVKRKRFRPNVILSPYFIYLPNSIAPPPSDLRRLCYRFKQPLPGPEKDPSSWLILSPVLVQQSTLTLALSSPLICAVKSFIHLRLVVDGPNEIDVSTIHVHLVQSFGHNLRDQLDFPTVKVVGRAVFWQSLEGSQILEGELAIKSSLKPTFTFPGLVVGYSLQLSTHEGRIPLISQDIVITCRQTSGVISRSYAPAGRSKSVASTSRINLPRTSS